VATLRLSVSSRHPVLIPDIFIPPAFCDQDPAKNRQYSYIRTVTVRCMRSPTSLLVLPATAVIAAVILLGAGVMAARHVPATSETSEETA